MKENTILPQVIEANDEGGYNAIVFVDGRFILRTFTVQNNTDGEIGVWEDVMGAPKWDDFMDMCCQIVNANFVSKAQDLIMEYRAAINRMNDIAAELARKHDISINIIPIAHSHSLKTGDRLEYSYLNANFRKVM